MANSQNFETALNQGKLAIRAMWYNPNAPKYKVTIQFSGRANRSTIKEEFFTGSTGTPVNNIIRIAGGTTGYNFTVLGSWKLEALQERLELTSDFMEKLMSSHRQKPLVFYQNDDVVTATELYGTPITAAIERCTVPNTRTLAPQQPVQAPDGSATLMFENKPVYQHTWLIEGNTPAFIWSGHVSVNPSLQEQPQAQAKEATVQELVTVEDLM